MRKAVVAVGCGLAIVLLAGFGGIWGYHQHAKTKARDALTQAATKLSDCLLGGPADGDVDQKLHRIAIASHASYTPDDSATGWPRRCAEYVPPIRQVHRAGYAVGIIATQPSFDAAHDTLADGKLTAIADLLRSVADFTHGAHDPAVALAPAPMTPLVSKDALQPIGDKVDFGHANDVLVRAQNGVRFAMTNDTATHEYGCEYDATTKKLQCALAPTNSNFVAGDIGAPFIFSTNASATIVSVLDDRGVSMVSLVNPLLSPTILHARSFKDGHIAVFASEYTDGPDAAKLIVRDAAGHEHHTEFDAGALGGGNRAGGPYLAWKERPASTEDPTALVPVEHPATIKARAMSGDAHTVTVGTVERRPPAAVRTDGTCEADQVFFDMSPALVAVDDKAHWHMLKQEPLTTDAIAMRTLSCRADILAILDLNEHDVHEQQCSVSAGCKTESVSVTFPSGAMGIATQKDVVVIWRDEAADAIYFVRGSLADLPKAMPRALVDSALSMTPPGGGLTGLSTTVPAIFAFGDEVVALLGDRSTYAIALHTDGTVTALAATPRVSGH